MMKRNLLYGLFVFSFIITALFVNAEVSFSCSDGYYWDSYTNSCQIYCGSYSTSASCISASGCVWNSTNNYCSSTSSSNTSTGSSCSSGYYWDSATNSCKANCESNSTSTSCASAGCTWNSTGNYCYQGSSNTSTSSSCSSGYYWDSSTNSCQPSSSCTSYTTTATCTAASGCAWNSTGNYCYSASTSNTATAPTGTPSAPSGLTAILVPGTTNVNLSWTDTAPNTETFKIYRRKSNTTSWELIATQAYSLKTYTDLSLALGSSYEYYIVACSSAGCSGQSNWAYVSVSSSSKTITGTVLFSDGTPVTDAKVNAWNKNANEGKESATASDGSYTLAVSGGTWELHVYPTSANATWSYTQSPKTASFAADETMETTTISFTVVRTDAAIKGKIVKPDGNAPDASKVQVNFQSSGGSWFYGNLASDGSFTAKVTAGTYSAQIYVQDSNLTAPLIPSLSVTSGETKDIGTITLVAATKTITGTVAFGDNTPVGGASVDAYQQATNKNVHAETNSSGVYTVSVSGGTWEVSVRPSSASAQWNYSGPASSVSFASDASPETATRNFTVTKADSAVKGRITLPDGSVPPADAVYVNIYSSQGSPFSGPVDASGQFRIGVPAGTYSVSLWSNNKSYTAPPVSNITVATGETKDIGTIVLIAATKIITGTVSYADGRPVTDASVGAFQKSTQQWSDSSVDSNGKYTIKVLGGSWEVSIHPMSQQSQNLQWNYSQEPKLATFKEDATPETITLQFTVTATDAGITGKIVKPDGTIPSSDTVYVNVEGSEGKNFSGSINSTGSFNIPVTAGTYRLFLWSQDPSLSAPSGISVTVAPGASTDVGTIRLIEKTDHIKGVVRDSSGKGISMIEVNAWMPQGSTYVSTKTDTVGSFDLLVTPGEWEVHVRPDSSTNYYSSDPPQRVSVIAGTPVTIQFTLQIADAGVSGTVVDATGTLLSNLYGYVNLSQSLMDNHTGLGGSIERGTFSFKAPAGTYVLFLFLSPESSYTAGEGVPIVLQAGETKTIKIPVSKNTSAITGTLQDEKGMPVTNTQTRVFATSGKGVWQEGRVDTATGRYILKVAAGTWYVGYDIDPASNYLSAREPNVQVEVKEGETVTQNLVVKKAGSVIKGRVTDPTGTGVFNAFVGVSKSSFSGALQSGEFKDPIVTHTETDATGAYRIAIPAGSYYIKTFVSPDRGFINSKEVAITIAEGETKIVDLSLRKADLAIIGSVLQNGTPVSDVFVWGWSDKGGYQESFSRLDGSFRLNVTGSDKWTIAAAGEINGVFYKSSEVVVEVRTANITRDIYLTKQSELPKAVVQMAEATKPTVVEVEGGATIIAPANAVSTSGSVQIQAAPDTRIPSQGEIKVVGVAYNLSARDETGQEITSFKTNVTISLPYKEEDVRALGTQEDNLIMSFWDETAATWKTLDRSVVNKEKKLVTASVDHFTRFAIIAAADITPPQPPANILAAALAGGGIQLTWANPSTDFHHAKIYRSSTVGSLGSNIAVDVLTNVFSDIKDIVVGTTYYYTVRAVDAAGNESNNISGIAAVATVSTLVSTPPSTIAALPPGQAGNARIESDLKLDSTGPAVTLLQQLLVAEGVYPEGRITGYFGPLTYKAVIRFQEKYAAEILRPANLPAGTGYVGPATRAKMNTILSTGIIALDTRTRGLPPSSITPTVSGALKRNLTVGSRGEDVRTLQRFLNNYGISITSNGPGSPGNETDYFGALTKTAVIRFQESHEDEILYPANLSSGTGFVGPATRTLINRALPAQ